MSKNPHLLRKVPENQEAEKAVLGAIMMRPNALFEIGDTLQSSSFYNERHRMIFECMRELSAKNEPIDLVSLSTKLKSKNILEAVGGKSYLAEIATATPSSTNVKYYADIVNRKALLRALIEAADYISDLGFAASEEEIEEILDRAEKKIFSITDAPTSKGAIHLKDSLRETWEELERLHASTEEIRGVPTGFRDLDNLTAGLQKSDLIILAARPSVGKTTLALDIARNAAVVHNVPTLIFSLEMSHSQLAGRMLSAQSHVSAWNIRTGQKLKERDFNLIGDALDTLAKAPIYIDDQPANTIVNMRALARRLKSEGKLGFIIVDYLQLMNTTKNYDSPVHQVTEISRSLKALARELNVPVLALSQLSRAVESRGGKPRLSDLRDSGSIEQDADLVMFIHRDDRYKDASERTNMAEILIEKHRNGPTGQVQLYFDGPNTKFMSVEKESLDNFAPASAPQPEGGLDDF